jgi:hypothetical protein
MAGATHTSARMDLTTTKKKARTWAIRAAIGIPLLVILGFVAYTEITLHLTFAEGERVGFVQKLAKRGWACKTYEGDLAMVNVTGQQAEIWKFTVPDQATADLIQSFEGHRVSLKYEEHQGVPMSCFGDSQYFVVGARKVD